MTKMLNHITGNYVVPQRRGDLAYLPPFQPELDDIVGLELEMPWEDAVAGGIWATQWTRWRRDSQV